QSGTFTFTQDMGIGRADHTATLLPNGKVLITGGVFTTSPAPVPTQSAELYDPATGTFTTTGSLNTARSLHSATLLNNGKVLIAGGYGGNGGALSTAELYNPVTGSFKMTTGNMQAPG